MKHMYIPVWLSIYLLKLFLRFRDICCFITQYEYHDEVAGENRFNFDKFEALSIPQGGNGSERIVLRETSRPSSQHSTSVAGTYGPAPTCARSPVGALESEVGSDEWAYFVLEKAGRRLVL